MVVPTGRWCLRNMAVKLRYIVLSFFLFILIIALVVMFWLFRLHQHIQEKPMQIDAPGYLVDILPGMSVQKIAGHLAKDGVLKHPNWFVIWVKFSHVRYKLKAGEYMLKPGMTPEDFIQLMVSGKVYQHPLTIVEGWTFDQLIQALNEEPSLQHTIQGLSYIELMQKLGYPSEHPEGQFFPETYRFPKGTTDVAFLQRAYKMMQHKLNKIWQERDPKISLKNPYEALILASIIEKESNLDEEYPEIAGVFIRRLERNMPLQADPTIVYSAGRNYQGRITSELLKMPSPYNTYLNTGLPPTPIAFPSQKALYAATHPKEGDSLYFVARGNGKGHVFSKTLEEHNKAVNEYRQNIQRNNMSSSTNNINIQNNASHQNSSHFLESR